MNSIVQTRGSNAIGTAGNVLLHLGSLLFKAVASHVTTQRDKKLVLERAKPYMACTLFADYKEAVIESRTVVDSRGRVLAQVKLWLYHDTRKCFREVVFLNPLLRTSVGLSRIALLPMDFTKSDTPAALLEVTVRDFEGWMRNRTAGTQFGIEGARAAAAKDQPVTLAPLPAPLKSEMPNPVLPAAAKAESPAVTNVPAPALAKPVPAAAKTNLKARVEDITCGILTAFGPQERTIGDRKFFQFCVDLTLTEEPNRGTPTRIWGTDLERCIEEARADIGHHVEVHHHGALAVPGGGNHKNSFTVLVRP